MNRGLLKIVRLAFLGTLPVLLGIMVIALVLIKVFYGRSTLYRDINVKNKEGKWSIPTYTGEFAG